MSKVNKYCKFLHFYLINLPQITDFFFKFMCCSFILVFFKLVLSITIIYIAIVDFYLLNKLLFFEFIVIFIILDAILAAILKTACIAFRPKMPEWHSTVLSCTWPRHLKSIITFSIYPKTRFLGIMPFNVWTKASYDQFKVSGKA